MIDEPDVSIRKKLNLKFQFMFVIPIDVFDPLNYEQIVYNNRIFGNRNSNVSWGKIFSYSMKISDENIYILPSLEYVTSSYSDGGMLDKKGAI